MPCRSEAPLVAIRNPPPARWPTTVGPVQPGEGCTATPTGLSITTIESSSWMIWIPSTISGTTSSGSARPGMVTSSVVPGVTRSLLADRRHRRPGRGRRPISSAARVRERPNIRARAASTRSPASPSGTRTTPVVDASGVPVVGPRLRVAVEPDRRGTAWSRISAGADVDADVGDVEDRPVRQHEEVDDVAAQRPRVAEEPVGEVAGDAGQQQPEATAQDVVPSRRREPQHDAPRRRSRAG